MPVCTNDWLRGEDGVLSGLTIGCCRTVRCRKVGWKIHARLANKGKLPAICDIPRMELLFGDLPLHKPRVSVLADFKVSGWDAIEPLFDQLETDLDACGSPESLEAWLLKVSELGAILDEDGARRYIAMTCHTSKDDAKGAS